MSAVITGKVWKFGDDINTDLVIPNFAMTLPRTEQPQYCFNANRPGWVNEVRPGDILLAGRNFGVGSARNIGDVFKQLGISAIIAESFNSLGLRNCVNMGVPSLPCKGVHDAFAEGDVAEVDWTSGAVRNLTNRSAVSLTGQPLPAALQAIIKAGGVEAVLTQRGLIEPLTASDRR
jgi:3-isopropylmalate/(R)-2-methylmalate dehydratase small subunit